jgi:hypothetical protein
MHKGVDLPFNFKIQTAEINSIRSVMQLDSFCMLVVTKTLLFGRM